MKRVLLAAGMVSVLAFTAVLSSIFLQGDGPGSGGPGSEAPIDEKTDFKTFSSFDEIESFLEENNEQGGGRFTYPNLDSTGYARRYGNDMDDTMEDSGGFNHPSPPALSDDDDDSSSNDYSTTNVQEQGVDEGDVVKNDGGHCYMISRDQRSVFVLDVYPAEASRLVHTIELTKGSAQGLYLLGDRLVVLCTYSDTYEYFYNGQRRTGSSEGIDILVYDIEERGSPMLFREDVFKGRFIDSRMIGSHFYLIGNQYENEIDNETDLPVPPDEVQYIDEYDDGYTFTSVASIDVLSSDAAPTIRTMLLGFSSEVYVSLSNIYITRARTMSFLEQKEREVEEVLLPLLPDLYKAYITAVINSDMTRSEKMDEIDRMVGYYLDNLTGPMSDEFYSRWREKMEEFHRRIGPELEVTEVHRISIIDGFINLKASGSVPGYILNRFSMGEYGGYFRIATTTGHVSREDEGTARNHVFILDMNLIMVGNITDIAPGERIYSARFMGERAYLVTFDKVDPFFVIDVSDPLEPKILGELKIPGYSDYLHPYDQDHIIGLGKDTVLADEGSFSWYQGVKLSLFDVTDLNNPKELSKYIIGDRGTESIAQYDPHAFLFSLKKKLLVLPIELYEIDESQYPEGAPPNEYGDFVWEGAYVFEVTTTNGFVLKGRIVHTEGFSGYSDYHWYENYLNTIYRSFYIDDVIYTVSFSKLTATDMVTMVKIKEVALPIQQDEEDYYGYLD